MRKFIYLYSLSVVNERLLRLNVYKHFLPFVFDVAASNTDSAETRVS